MPYKTTKDLPAGTKGLPAHGLDIYLAAFNAAWDEYEGAEDREQRCHATAWAAVKQKYEKRNGKWRTKPDEKTAESFVPMPMMLLAESDAVLSEAVGLEWLEDEVSEADETPRLIATLIKAGDNKSGTRRYTPEFLQKCVSEGRFTGSYGYANHPSTSEARERPERDLRYLAARTGEAFWDESSQSVKAPLVWLAEEHPQSMGGLVSALFADPVVRQRSGLSIYYQGPVQVEEAESRVRPGRKVVVPKALGDDRKFDVDIVTAPGAGGSLPLLEAERPETEEVKPMTLDEMKAQFPDLMAQLREEIVAEVSPPAEPEPVVEPEPEPETEPAVAEAVEVDAPKPEATAPGTEALLREVAELKSWRMLETALAAEPVDETIREAARKALADDVFETREAFQAKFRATVDGLKEVASKAAGPRVADLGGAPPAESDKFTLGDLTKQKEA